jgi:hypothetical protein
MRLFKSVALFIWLITLSAPLSATLMNFSFTLDWNDSGTNIDSSAYLTSTTFNGVLSGYTNTITQDFIDGETSSFRIISLSGLINNTLFSLNTKRRRVGPARMTFENGDLKAFYYTGWTTRKETPQSGEDGRYLVMSVTNFYDQSLGRVDPLRLTYSALDARAGNLPIQCGFNTTVCKGKVNIESFQINSNSGGNEVTRVSAPSSMTLLGLGVISLIWRVKS